MPKDKKKLESLLAQVEIEGITALNSGGRKRPLATSSRREEMRSETVIYRFRPTGVTGTVDIPPGHYSKRQMQRLREVGKVQFLTDIGLLK